MRSYCTHFAGTARHENLGFCPDLCNTDVIVLTEPNHNDVACLMNMQHRNLSHATKRRASVKNAFNASVKKAVAFIIFVSTLNLYQPQSCH